MAAATCCYGLTLFGRPMRWRPRFYDVQWNEEDFVLLKISPSCFVVIIECNDECAVRASPPRGKLKRA